MVGEKKGMQESSHEKRTEGRTEVRKYGSKEGCNARKGIQESKKSRRGSLIRIDP